MPLKGKAVSACPACVFVFRLFVLGVGVFVVGCSRSTQQGIPEEACGGPKFCLMVVYTLTIIYYYLT